MDGGKWQLSRATVVSWAGSFIDLLFPIYNSQQLSILDGKVISMDETPYKIGHSDGKMNNQYLWFMYGDKDEVLVHPPRVWKTLFSKAATASEAPVADQSVTSNS